MMDGGGQDRAGGRTHALRAQIILRERILGGELPGGARLSEIQLAQDLGISRTPVREALSRLAEEGLLRRNRSGGFLVRSFAVADVLDMIELRGVLEGTAARLAAERGPCAAAMADARRCRAALDACFGSGPAEVDLDRYTDLNSRFHLALSRLPRSRVLEEEIARVSRLPFAAPSAFLPHKRRVEALAASLGPAHAQHHALIAAIEAGQGTRAEYIAREHSQVARANVEPLFESLTLNVAVGSGLGLGRHGDLEE